MTDQEVFETVYRKRQGVLHHASYIRMCKVLLILRMLRLTGIQLNGKSLLDYGFGAGTFFRYCPQETLLYGVEQDSVVCHEVAEMLRERGIANANLQTIDIANWAKHPLLQNTYDVFLCSHVLEHLPNPVDFLKTVRRCVKPDGVFLGLVPINERKANPHHLQTVDRATVCQWAAAAGYEVVHYEENDPFLYWIQPLFTADAGWRHKLAQIASLSLGIPATLCGERLWFGWGKIFAKLTSSQPTQAGFVLRIKG